MRRRIVGLWLRSAFLVWALVVLPLFMQPAAAGGRCEEMLQDSCFSPRAGDAGTRVELRRAASKVMWNEPRLNASGYNYRPDLPTIELAASNDGDLQDGLSFLVPDVPAGVYEVVLYDRDTFWWGEFAVESADSAVSWYYPGLILVSGLVVVGLWLRHHSSVRPSEEQGMPP